MARPVINPDIMEWARENAGFTNEYIELLPEYIKKDYKYWENGDKYPAWNQLRKVSKKYNIPSAFFSWNTSMTLKIFQN